VIGPAHHTARLFVPGQPEGEETRVVHRHREWRQLFGLEPMRATRDLFETHFVVDLWMPSRRYPGTSEEQTLHVSACSAERDVQTFEGQNTSPANATPSDCSCGSSVTRAMLGV